MSDTNRTIVRGPFSFQIRFENDDMDDLSDLGEFTDRPKGDYYVNRRDGMLYGPQLTVTEIVQRPYVPATYQTTKIKHVHQDGGEAWRAVQNDFDRQFPDKTYVNVVLKESGPCDEQGNMYGVLGVPDVPYKLPVAAEWTIEFPETWELLDDDGAYDDIVIDLNEDRSFDWYWFYCTPGGQEADPKVATHYSRTYAKQNILATGLSVEYERHTYKFWEPGPNHNPPALTWDGVSREHRADLLRKHGPQQSADICYIIQDYERCHGFGTEWSYYYVHVTMFYRGYEVCDTGLGGVESDSEDSYFDEVVEEQISECLAQAAKETDIFKGLAAALRKYNNVKDWSKKEEVTYAKQY